jgi:hypothetical protein
MRVVNVAQAVIGAQDGGPGPPACGTKPMKIGQGRPEMWAADLPLPCRDLPLLPPRTSFALELRGVICQRYKRKRGHNGMLAISQSVMDAFAHEQTDSMIERIARWLSRELRDWNGAPGTSGRRDLEEIVRIGGGYGMEVETDCALLAVLLLSANDSATGSSFTSSGWRDLIAQPDVSAVLSGTDRNPPSKLLWLEARLEC